MEQTTTTITCPHCHKQIPLDEALSHRIREQLQKEFNAEMAKREQEVKDREAAYVRKTQELEQYRERLKTEQQASLEQMRQKLSDELRAKAEEKVSVELQDLRQEVEEKGSKLAELQKAELQLRKEKRELEESKQNLELEITRRLDAERETIRAQALKTMSEEHRFKDMEKDKIIDDLKKQADDLKRKLDQSSQQLQGEVLELEIENLLKLNFPLDTVEPVPKGIRGADVIQRVCGQGGQECGTIMWESKRTKAWSDSWIDKLKEDQREARADVAVLVSTVLPRGLCGIGQVNGVWVCEDTLAMGLATALRSGLLQLAMTRLSLVGKNEKMEMLYEYLSGREFRHHVEGIVEAFVAMKKELDQERRAMEKMWARREKQIERVIKNTARMYGNMQGIIGRALPELKVLELEAYEADRESTEADDA